MPLGYGMEPELEPPTGPAGLELERVIVIDVVHELLLAEPGPARVLDVSGYGAPLPVPTWLMLTEPEAVPVGPTAVELPVG